MSQNFSRENRIAKRYGGALFRLAQENKMLKSVLKEVTHLHQCLVVEPREWGRVVSPTTPLRVQQQIVKELALSLNLGDLITSFLKVVCDNYRLQNLTSMLENFMARHKEEEGVIEGVLETAIELSEKDIKNLQAVLKQQLNKDVELQQEIKGSLLGGITLRIGSLMIDASVKTQLNKLHHRMRG